jgi:signal transduction histidine kinase
VLWLLSTVFAPTAVLMHLWYPSRPVAAETLLRAQRWWLVALLVLQGTFAVFVIVGHTTIGLLRVLDTGTTVAFLGSFVLSAGVLWKAYQETTISHIRRQIRLIAWACAVVACVWLFVLLGQIVAPTLMGVVPPVTFTVVAIVVPLAYLVGGVGRDLLRVDMLARQLVIHAGTLVALVALLAVVGQLSQRTLAPALLVAVSVALYRPMFGLIQRLPVFGRAEERAFERLGATTTLLGSTLEAPQLARIVSDGVRDAFRNPSLALYLQHSPGEQRLKRIVAQRLLTPERVSVATLSQLVQRDEVLISTGTLQQRAASRGLDTSDAALIYAPRASLWGLLRDTRGSPIGLLVLGPRGDLDPYREQDMRELGRLLGAAALAFTNSAAYEKQVRAERVIRKLYHRLQEIQDEAEAMIARELHHVLNVSVRLNIEALERVLKRAELVAPELSDELEELLETEQAAGVMLRLLCDSLVLTNRSEPRSLASSLRRTAEHAAAGWEGALHVQVDQVPVDIAPLVYRELVVITREGVTNAVKHGQANEIVVALRVPAGEDQPLVLSIRNDGPLQGEIMAKAGHVGLHFMHESAARIGATIAWIPQATGGVDVVVTAPRVGRPEPDDSGLLSDWGGIVPTINSDDTGESPTRPEDTVKRGDLQ